MSCGIRKTHLISFFNGPKQHSHLIPSEEKFIIVIINSRPGLTGATCSQRGELHGYVALDLLAKRRGADLDTLTAH